MPTLGLLFEAFTSELYRISACMYGRLDGYEPSCCRAEFCLIGCNLVILIYSKMSSLSEVPATIRGQTWLVQLIYLLHLAGLLSKFFSVLLLF